MLLANGSTIGQWLKLFQNILEITPGTCGGRPRIAGHWITVQDVVVWYKEMNLSPQDIVERYSTITLSEITLSDVHAALAYYYDNKQEIQQQIQEGKQLEAEMRASIPYQSQTSESMANHVEFI